MKRQKMKTRLKAEKQKRELHNAVKGGVQIGQASKGNHANHRNGTIYNHNDIAIDGRRHIQDFASHHWDSVFARVIGNVKTGGVERI